MPEHVLRTNLMKNIAEKSDFVEFTVERCWIDVASSISKFCAQDWYGYGSIKWKAIIEEMKVSGHSDGVL